MSDLVSYGCLSDLCGLTFFFSNMTSGPNLDDETGFNQGQGYGQGIRTVLAAVCLVHSSASQFYILHHLTQFFSSSTSP